MPAFFRKQKSASDEETTNLSEIRAYQMPQNLETPFMLELIVECVRIVLFVLMIPLAMV